ncbi:ATP phosphoribosyltransferase (homohexameric) [Abditibacterium utsteinense]|uniref:ATP phosphoribosyltransferase n=1 Tax=Abditibacterium utsteinense TaxID=1960156 RepID=A0A2S8SVT8_9BACT|nr:ATP phosphoribosyltransferase (homohexameric) [Abditibacterium utsteinense]
MILNDAPSTQRCRLGLPKGSLQDATIRMMRRAGWNISVSERSYFPAVNDDDLEIVLLRAQEIPRYVMDGVLDAGITGYDNVLENSADIHEICELIYSKATSKPYRWVLAVPKGSEIKSAKDLEGKRIATELVNVTRRYLESHDVKAEVEFSWGATEVKVPSLVDAIVEGTETGSTLRAHGLEIIDELLSSTTRFIANHNSWNDAWKREKLSNMATLLQGAMQAEGKVGLKMNAPRQNLEQITQMLPAMNTPTISPLADESYVALEIIADESRVRDLIPNLLRAGATGIIEYPLNKVIA